jgi:hypothetical protein
MQLQVSCTYALPNTQPRPGSLRCSWPARDRRPWALFPERNGNVPQQCHTCLLWDECVLACLHPLPPQGSQRPPTARTGLCAAWCALRLQRAMWALRISMTQQAALADSPWHPAKGQVAAAAPMNTNTARHSPGREGLVCVC